MCVGVCYSVTAHDAKSAKFALINIDTSIARVLTDLSSGVFAFVKFVHDI